MYVVKRCQETKYDGFPYQPKTKKKIEEIWKKENTNKIDLNMFYYSLTLIRVYRLQVINDN